MDDILLTGCDDTCIQATKTYLQQHLIILDLGSPRYFLGIEFAHQDGKLALTQRKYTDKSRLPGHQFHTVSCQNKIQTYQFGENILN